MGRIGVETSPRAKASRLPPGVGGREPTANRLGGQSRSVSDGNVRWCGPRRSSVAGSVAVPSRLTPRPMGRPRLVRGVVGRWNRPGRATQRRCPMLEPYALKGARTVLRGGGAGDSTSLPDRPTWAPGREPRAVHRAHPHAPDLGGRPPDAREGESTRTLARASGWYATILTGRRNSRKPGATSRPAPAEDGPPRAAPVPRGCTQYWPRDISRDGFAAQSQWCFSARTSCSVGGYVDRPRPAGVKWRRPAGVGSCGLGRICGQESAGTSLELTAWRRVPPLGDAK